MILTWLFKTIFGMFTGGGLEKILDVIEHKMDDETKKEEIKAEVTKTWINAQANLLVGRTWWFQLLFLVPLGIWWAAVIADSVCQFDNWNVAALPSPLDSWAASMIGAVFVIDGGKALVGRVAGAFGKGN
jgi:hypothetical protein